MLVTVVQVESMLIYHNDMLAVHLSPLPSQLPLTALSPYAARRTHKHAQDHIDPLSFTSTSNARRSTPQRDRLFLFCLC